ncbi:MAG: type II toxin-antitoxin system HicB family antitoxin [Bacteroides sp.]|nr:type II toxin-antitoxin system HicB family antitoxin [Bacteroides sp.]
MKKINSDNHLNVLQYKGYVGSIEVDLENNSLYGVLLGMDKGFYQYEAKTIEELKEEFQNVVDMYLEHCEEHGLEPQKPFTGRFSIRISPELHQKAVEVAKKKRISLNKLVNEAIASLVL